MKKKVKERRKKEEDGKENVQPRCLIAYIYCGKLLGRVH
jgi:hypothetical protein